MNDLAELKRFIISEMKNKNSEWKDCGRYSSHFRFESKYIGIYKKDGGSNSYEKESYIQLNTRSEKIYIKTFGLSEWRLTLLIKFYVKRFCKDTNRIAHENHVKHVWEDFLKKNKDLNRDRRLEELGIHDK
jgi:hypothetical protein